MTPCACGQTNIPPGVISIYDADGVHHWPADLVCFESADDLWAVSP